MSGSNDVSFNTKSNCTSNVGLSLSLYIYTFIYSIEYKKIDSDITYYQPSFFCYLYMNSHDQCNIYTQLLLEYLSFSLFTHTLHFDKKKKENVYV